MNDAKQQLDAGDLTGAIETALATVKANPTNEAARIFLFELSCFSGDWERAERQLEVIGHQDANAAIGTLIYRQNFKAERDRAKFFESGVKPEFLSAPPEYVAGLLAANSRLREGNVKEARQLLDDVETHRLAISCVVNGETYEDFRDYNDATMCIFEVILKDTYCWLPMEQIEKIEFFKPKSLRDLYWVQGEITMRNGTGGEMFVPALYANSWKSENDQVRLGRMTDWQDAGEEIFTGEGTKMFWMDGKEKSIFDLEKIEFKEDETGA